MEIHGQSSNTAHHYVVQTHFGMLEGAGLIHYVLQLPWTPDTNDGNDEKPDPHCAPPA
jgi:hypothetical protein